MKKERRHYDKEFKEMAINLVQSGKRVQHVALELGVRAELIHRWKREYTLYGTGSFSGQGTPNMTEEQKEISTLKKQLLDAQLERDILKKAINIFSRGDNKSTIS